MSNREDYFRDARSWADDARIGAARSRRIAWTIAGIAVAVAAFEAVALAMLAPLKTVQPITLLVDRQTGYVQALDPTTPKRIGADAALTDAYLAQYVAAREGFDRATVQNDYRKVGLWSIGRARLTYVAGIAATNPASPFQYPVGTIVTVRVKSVSRLSQGISLVRFDTQRIDRSGGGEAARPWIAVVRFRYSDASMQLEDRLLNPLGFQVTGYRRDAEAPPIQARPVSTPPQFGAETSAVAQPILRVAVAEPASRPRRVVGAATVETPPSRRELPINQIPMGSPLSPGPTSILSGTPS